MSGTQSIGPTRNGRLKRDCLSRACTPPEFPFRVDSRLSESQNVPKNGRPEEPWAGYSRPNLLDEEANR